jgi:hypothetical protein
MMASSLWILLNIPAKVVSALAVVGVVAALSLPGPVIIDNAIVLYENEQWDGRRVLELSPEMVLAIENNDPSVEVYRQQLEQLRAVQDDPALNMVYAEESRSDGWLVATAVGTGAGFDKLNELFFGGRADISVSPFETGTSQREVSIFEGNRNPGEIASAGGSESWRITGEEIFASNADQVQSFDSAIWVNPFELNVTLSELPGAPTNSLAGGVTAVVVPAPGGEPPPIRPGQPTAVAQQAGVNVIRNGDFEQLPWPEDGIAPEWEGYNNGQAHFGWYEELWPEAVFEGFRAQLMEIFEHDDTVQNRVIAVYQTVDVAQDSEYHLSMQTILRSSAPPEARNSYEAEMHWGIDPSGTGDYENVETWIPMELTEQYRLGSNGEFPDDVPLFYELITGTVQTGDSSQITLFIRGLKKFPTNVEVNMDIDNVELIGPDPGTAQVVSVPEADQPTAEEDKDLPTTGAILSRPGSVGILVFGSLVVIIAGTAAVLGLLGHRRDL